MMLRAHSAAAKHVVGAGFIDLMGVSFALIIFKMFCLPKQKGISSAFLDLSALFPLVYIAVPMFLNPDCHCTALPYLPAVLELTPESHFNLFSSSSVQE